MWIQLPLEFGPRRAGANPPIIFARASRNPWLNAARWTAQRREELLSAGLGIAFETVLSADDKIDFMRRARDSGYFLRLFFVGTDDPRINAARVAGRIMTGGHAVPIEKIVSRYVRSMANIKIVARIAHRVYLFDNSIDNVDARLCARIEDGALRKVYGVQPRWVESATDGLVRHPAFVDTRNFVVLPVLPKGA